MLSLRSQDYRLAASTGSSVLITLAVVIVSIVLWVYQSHRNTIHRQTSALERVLRLQVDGLVHELKAGILGADVHQNALAGDPSRLRDHYGATLDRLIGFSQLFVLDGNDRPIYGYSRGAELDVDIFEDIRSAFPDLLFVMRADPSGRITHYPVVESRIPLGDQRAVNHKGLADFRFIDGTLRAVIVSTLSPESAKDSKSNHSAPLLVAMKEFDASELEKIGGAVGLDGLSWRAIKDDGCSEFCLSALNGKSVAEFNWASGTQAWHALQRVAPGLAAALLLFGIGAARFANASFRQAHELANKSRELSTANELLERRIQERSKEYEVAIQAANAANEAKSRFLSTMSHEMRTPLNGLIGALDLIQKSPLESQQVELVNIALQSSEALLVHINDVLDISKLEAGKLELDRKPFDLHRMVESVMGIIRPQVDAQKNRIELRLEEDVPQFVVGDSVRLRQIVLNLVTNANKFTRCGRIDVSVERQGEWAGQPLLRFSVADTGIGIPSDRLHDLFEEFTMIESGFTRKSGGTGLGLAISKRLVKLMSGTIGVESVVGQGSTFWFTVALPVTEQVALEIESGHASHDNSASGLRLLLVDDNATNRFIGSRLLKSGGHVVAEAKDGREAVDLASREHYDAILMDISMPEMDGVMATSLIRKLDAPFGNVPIIALTANAIIGDRERFLAAGMNDYLTKPFRLADMQRKLAHLVKNAGEVPVSKVFGAPANTLAQLPIINASELSELTEATSAHVVRCAIETFATEARVRQQELTEAIGRRDVREVGRVCHAIAGAARSLGAVRLGDTAKRVEIACYDGREKGLELAGQVMPLLHETEFAFQSYLSAERERPQL